MTDAHHLRDLLLPELELEFDKTRKLIHHLPDGQQDFKPHEKSFTFSRLAGHTAELPGFIAMILTTPGFDVSSGGRTALNYQSRPQLLAEFNELADKAITALKTTSDDAFNQNWKLSFKQRALFDGTRYNAYRQMGLNHLIHHRAQLGVNLRLLNCPVPATFGPSADEPLSA